jgi:hypothetical protein
VESQLDELSAEESTRVADLSGIETRVAAQQRVLSEHQESLARLSVAIDDASGAIAACDEELSDPRSLAKLTAAIFSTASTTSRRARPKCASRRSLRRPVGLGARREALS